MILNMVGGGGAGLNFSVKAYASESALPSVEKESTIAVITETEITSWIFSATEPETPEAGMVWFSTGTVSTAEFNALKKNGIMVYPISGKQYVSGAWVPVTAKSYLGGSWVDWMIRIYDNGTKAVELEVSNKGGTNATEDANKLILQAKGVGNGYWVTKDPIAISNAQTLCADVYRYSGSASALWIGLVTSKDTASPVVSISFNSAAYEGVSTVALNNIPAGEYYVKAYIGVVAGNGAILEIRRISIE